MSLMHSLLRIEGPLDKSAKMAAAQRLAMTSCHVLNPLTNTLVHRTCLCYRDHTGHPHPHLQTSIKFKLFDDRGTSSASRRNILWGAPCGSHTTWNLDVRGSGTGQPQSRLTLSCHLNLTSGHLMKSSRSSNLACGTANLRTRIIPTMFC